MDSFTYPHGLMKERNNNTHLYYGLKRNLLTPLCVSGLGRAFARFHAPYRHGGRIRVYHAAVLAPLRFPHSFMAYRLLSRYLLMYSYSLSFRFH